MLRKTEVYTWRMSPVMKASLEELAYASDQSVAELLDEIVLQRIEAATRATATELARQQALHARAARAIGTRAGRDPSRSARVRELVRARLKDRQARAHSRPR